MRPGDLRCHMAITLCGGVRASGGVTCIPREVLTWMGARWRPGVPGAFGYRSPAVTPCPSLDRARFFSAAAHWKRWVSSMLGALLEGVSLLSDLPSTLACKASYDPS